MFSKKSILIPVILIFIILGYVFPTDKNSRTRVFDLISIDQKTWSKLNSSFDRKIDTVTTYHTKSRPMEECRFWLKSSTEAKVIQIRKLIDRSSSSKDKVIYFSSSKLVVLFQDTFFEFKYSTSSFFGLSNKLSKISETYCQTNTK